MNSVRRQKSSRIPSEMFFQIFDYIFKNNKKFTKVIMYFSLPSLTIFMPISQSNSTKENYHWFMCNSLIKSNSP